MTPQIEPEKRNGHFQRRGRNKVEEELHEKPLFWLGRGRWLARLEKFEGFKQRLEEAKHHLDVMQRQGQIQHSVTPLVRQRPRAELPAEGHQVNRDNESPLAMLHDRVMFKDISRVFAKATCILVRNLLKRVQDKLDQMEDSLSAGVIGQDHNQRCRASHAGVQAPISLYHHPCSWGRLAEVFKALAAPLFGNLARENEKPTVA